MKGQNNNKNNEPDFYGILNVSPTASNEEIQKAYKMLSKTFHPDRLMMRSRHAAATAAATATTAATAASTAELAQETFVSIKTAHDVLCDPVYRFAYDQYQHEGVHFLRHCHQQKEGHRRMKLQQSKQQQQQNVQMPLDIHLYSKLYALLATGSTTSSTTTSTSMHLSIASRMLKAAIQRFRRQRQQLQQRIQDSTFQFDATLELPCAYHPYGGVAANESETLLLPYLELEQGHMDFTVRKSNRRPQVMASTADQEEDGDQDQQRQQQALQKHIVTTSFGTSTEWEANGKANAEVTLGMDYQESPASKTQWSCEVSAPISKIPPTKQQQQQQQQQQRQANKASTSTTTTRPFKMSLSTTHEFLTGTVSNVGIRGSNVSKDSWEYFITSFRKLAIGNQVHNNANANTNTGLLQPNIRASYAMGMRIFSQKPLYAFVALNSIPPSTEQQHQQENKQYTFIKKLHCSTPEIQVRGGYHPSPLHASMKFEEFLTPWMSLFASWSWSLAHECSKIKILLSTDFWGFWNENDSTTLKTGIRHDLMSGWIWLFEWEELDWTLKVPISLSMTKNTPWIAPAVGVAVSQADILHHTMASFLASYISMKVARSILSDWQGETAAAAYDHDTAGGHPKRSDATRSDNERGAHDSFQFDHDEEAEGEEDGYYDYDDDATAKESKRRQRNKSTFHSFVVPVAQKKREVEKINGGLVLRFAKIMNAQKTFDAWQEGDLESFQVASRALIQHDITAILQFWVKDSKLELPPLASQPAPHFYSFGDRCRHDADADPNASSPWSLEYFSQQGKQFFQKWTTALQNVANIRRDQHSDSQFDTPTLLVIRYEYEGHVYEVSIADNEPIVLPNASALAMGRAERVQ